MEQKEIKNFLPLEMLLAIFLKIDDEKDLLSAKRVNKTWYHLIAGNDNIFAKLAQEKIEKLLESARIQNIPNTSNKTYSQMISSFKKINNKLNRVTTERTKITLKSQMRRDVLLQCAKDAIIHIKDFAVYVFGRGNPTDAILFILTFTMLMHLMIRASNLEPTFLDSVKTAIYVTGVVFISPFTKATFGVFLILFCMKFWENYKNSQALYHQEIVDELKNKNEIKSKSAEVSEPDELLTISWEQKNTFFSSKNAQSSKDETQMSNLKFSSKV